MIIKITVDNDIDNHYQIKTTKDRNYATQQCTTSWHIVLSSLQIFLHRGSSTLQYYLLVTWIN